LEPYAALNADPRVREFFPSVQTHQESADSMQSIRDHWQLRGFGLWAVEVIGGVAAQSMPSDDVRVTEIVDFDLDASSPSSSALERR
jgi:RimJ/RimL family protein N-acetyltransferase